MYIAMSTRPDIAHTASILSRYVKSPNEKDWVAAKKCVRYLKGTRSIGLLFGAASIGIMKDIVLRDNFCDADWGGRTEESKESTSGYLIMLNGAAISWASKKQTCIALSSAEAEHVSTTYCGQEIIWLRRLLADLGFEQMTATVIQCDNNSAIAIASDDVYHARTKHINMKHHWIRKAVEDKELLVTWVSTKQQRADILTKSIGISDHERMTRTILGRV